MIDRLENEIAARALEALASGTEPDVWAMLARWRSAGRVLVLLAVTETRGFTPRKTGARMLLAEDGETCGTIGGGAIEQAALLSARELLTGREASRTLRWHLTQELGMCCGGEMTVRIERVEPDPRLVVFGAGHVGRALALLARGCGFRVTLVDERPEWAEPARAPGVETVCRDPEAFARELERTARDYVVVVTHDHALDQRLVEVLLRRPLRFLGLVASVPKQRKFALRLRARGFADVDIARVRAPLGLAIGASTPEEIAVSAMAEVIATRRGITVDPPETPLRRQGSLRPETPVETAAEEEGGRP